MYRLLYSAVMVYWGRTESTCPDINLPVRWILYNTG